MLVAVSSEILLLFSGITSNTSQAHKKFNTADRIHHSMNIAISPGISWKRFKASRCFHAEATSSPALSILPLKDEAFRARVVKSSHAHAEWAVRFGQAG